MATLKPFVSICTGLKEVKVESIEEVILLCKYAQCNRKMAATMLNYASSRRYIPMHFVYAVVNTVFTCIAY